MSKYSIDEEHFRAQTADEPTLGREILGLFTNQLNQWMKVLKNCDDAQSWKDGTHAILGAARGVGAIELAIRCEDAENMTFADEIKRNLVFHELQTAVDLTIEEVAKFDYRLSMRELRQKTEA